MNVKLHIIKGNSEKSVYHFNNSFNVGRDENCSVHLQDELVSRFHLEVIHENNQWWIKDLDSTNGIFIGGEKVQKVMLENRTQIEIGEAGPVLLIELNEQRQEKATLSQSRLSLSHYIQYYFQDQENEGKFGVRTQMIRQAFEEVKKKQHFKYVKIIAIIAIIPVLLIIIIIYQQNKLNEQIDFAEEIFYKMKSIELNLVDDMNNMNTVYNEIEADYEKLIRKIGMYENLDAQETLIYRMAHIMGECELKIPSEFINEVFKYIQKWQTSNRLEEAIYRAKQNGYISIIKETLSKYNLPPQYFYLALQESNFKNRVVGPQTRFGIAKGIWQFIPKTALKYELNLGPWIDKRIYDPKDDRFNFEKATEAAAKYIYTIYQTEAQASGLLVMASYNWGEHNVRDLIAKLALNPRDRNFWRLLERYGNRIPNQTYDYVFYIFSASVIGENPELFGFNFKNPLE